MGVNILYDVWLLMGLQGTEGVHESMCLQLCLPAFLCSEGPKSWGLILRHIGPKMHGTTAQPPVVSPSLSTEGPVRFRNKGGAHHTIQLRQASSTLGGGWLQVNGKL